MGNSTRSPFYQQVLYFGSVFFRFAFLETIQHIFSDLPQIAAFHKVFLERISSAGLVTAFSEMSGCFKLYTSYIHSQSELPAILASLSFSNPKFAEFLRETQKRPEVGNLGQCASCLSLIACFGALSDYLFRPFFVFD